MAFIDSGVQASAYGGLNPGGPSGSGVAGAQMSPVAGYPGQPGSGGPGTNYSNRTWALTYLGFIIFTLVITGVIFNGKGRE